MPRVSATGIGLVACSENLYAARNGNRRSDAVRPWRNVERISRRLCGAYSRLQVRGVVMNDELRGGVKAFSNWPTIPQLYVKGEFVGGCDIIREMFQAGELQSLLKEKGVPVKEGAPA